MGKYRVLWNDSDDAGSGRWADVDAADEANAAWQAAVNAGQGSKFLAVASMEAAASPAEQ